MLLQSEHEQCVCRTSKFLSKYFVNGGKFAKLKTRKKFSAVWYFPLPLIASLLLSPSPLIPPLFPPPAGKEEGDLFQFSPGATSPPDMVPV